MTKVLVYSNRKIDPIIIDTSTPEKEAAAFLKLFKHLDEEWRVYDDLDPKYQNLWDKATTGDADAAKKLLKMRRNEEYESWYESQMIDPLMEKVG
jgi:hypothetical protein